MPPVGGIGAQFVTVLSVPYRTGLSISLYLLADQWVTATVVGTGRGAGKSKSAVGDRRSGAGEWQVARKARDDSLAVRGIGDFTKDGRAAGAGCGGDVAGALVERFVGQEGEGEGFFGVLRNV